MIVFGPLSSVFDFLTFAVMLGVFHAHADEFRSGWFVEPLATDTGHFRYPDPARAVLPHPPQPAADPLRLERGCRRGRPAGNPDCPSGAQRVVVGAGAG